VIRGTSSGAPPVPRDMRRLLLLAFLPFLLVACAGEVHQGGVTSGIEGRVTIGPTCPVEIAGSPCPDAPLAATITVRSESGDPVVDVETGDDGRFHIPLSPGTYTIEAEALHQDGIARMLPVGPVTVRSAAYTAVPISFDSGIR
jgi:hypothetical protein